MTRNVAGRKSSKLGGHFRTGKEMPKTAAPTKLVGGGGFEFENRVAALFVAKLPAGGMPLGPEVGRVVRLDFQTRKSGWLLDDMHLTFESADRSRCLAASVKSHRQVPRTGFPEDFVRALWEQWLRTGAGCFQEDRELLGLITSQLAGSAKVAWNVMLREAVAADPGRVAKQLTTAHHYLQIKRKLFARLRSDLAAERGTGLDAQACSTRGWMTKGKYCSVAGPWAGVAEGLA